MSINDDSCQVNDEYSNVYFLFVLKLREILEAFRFETPEIFRDQIRASCALRVKYF